MQQKSVKNVGSSAEAYRQRYKEYERAYIKAFPDPPTMDMQQQGGNSNTGAASAALKRSVRYNDRSTTNSTGVTKGMNNGNK